MIVAITAGLFSRRDSKRRALQLGHPQTTNELYDNLAALSHYIPQDRNLEEAQVYSTPNEGNEPTFTQTEPEPMSFDQHEQPNTSIHAMRIEQQPQEQPQQPSGEDETLHRVIQAAVQATMNYQAKNQQHFPTTSKNYKIADQAPFTGRAEQLEAFLHECEMRFKVLPIDYDTTDKKVFYMLSLMKGGTAAAWKDNYILSRQGMTYLAPANDWNNFVKALKDTFADPGKKQDAMEQLQTIRQGKHSIDELNTKFRLLVQKAGLDVTNNVELLIQMYERAINPALFLTLVVNGKSSTNSLDTYMKNASEVDRVTYVFR